MLELYIALRSVQEFKQVASRVAKWFFGDKDDGWCVVNDEASVLCPSCFSEEDACSSLYHNGDLLIETFYHLLSISPLLACFASFPFRSSSS